MLVRAKIDKFPKIFITVVFLSAPSRVAEKVGRIRLAAVLLGRRWNRAGRQLDVGRLGDDLVAF